MSFRAGTSGPASNSPWQGTEPSNVRERALIRAFYTGGQGLFFQRIFQPPRIPSEPTDALRARSENDVARAVSNGYASAIIDYRIRTLVIWSAGVDHIRAARTCKSTH
jgi:hypothetical protein